MNTNELQQGNLIIRDCDFPEPLNWSDAKQSCNNLGDGWRLPTKEELNTIYLNKTLLNIKGSFYWSSTDDGFYATYQYFRDGLQLSGTKDKKLFVRAVKNL